MLNNKQTKLILSPNQVSDFHLQGFLVIKQLAGLEDYLKNLQDELVRFSSLFFQDSSFEKMREQILSLSAKDRKAFYIALRYFSSVIQLASSPLLNQLSQELGLKHPAVMHSYNMRMDMPSEDQHLFHWHQDITYLLGSMNSVTYWIPLSSANATNGSISIIPGSHKSGLYPFHYAGRENEIPKHKSMSPSDIRLDQEPNAESLVVDVMRGDIVVFSQFLLHKSTPNRSDQIRWTVQVRHSDFGEEYFRKSVYPFGDVTNIFETDYLKGKKNG